MRQKRGQFFRFCLFLFGFPRPQLRFKATRSVPGATTAWGNTKTARCVQKKGFFSCPPAAFWATEKPQLFAGTLGFCVFAQDACFLFAKTRGLLRLHAKKRAALANGHDLRREFFRIAGARCVRILGPGSVVSN